MTCLSNRKIRRLTLFIIATLLAVIWYLDWTRITAHWVINSYRGVPSPAQQLDLTSYKISMEARPIQGLDANTSGLTFNEKTGTLFVAINRPPAVAEISIEGQLLRYIPLPSTKDPEGIAHVKDDLFVISDESDNRLHWITIRPGEKVTETAHVTTLPLNFKHMHNLGFEGISWDEKRSELLVVNEKWPRRVLMVSDLVQQGVVQESAFPVKDWKPAGWMGILGSDLASLTVHAPTGNLLVLSEESASIAEYSRQGQLLGVLPLWRGIGGLKQKIGQPEGIAIGSYESIYVISEPNLLYRFTKVNKFAKDPRV